MMSPITRWMTKPVAVRTLTLFATILATIGMVACNASGGDDMPDADKRATACSSNNCFTLDNSDDIILTVLMAVEQKPPQLPGGAPSMRRRPNTARQLSRNHWGYGEKRQASLHYVAHTSTSTLGAKSGGLQSEDGKNGTNPLLRLKKEGHLEYGCTLGGSVSITNSGGKLTYAKGDHLKYVYHDCGLKEGSGIYDGPVAFEYLKVTGQPHDKKVPGDWTWIGVIKYDVLHTWPSGTTETIQGISVTKTHYDAATSTITSDYHIVGYTGVGDSMIEWSYGYYKSSWNTAGHQVVGLNGTAEYDSPYFTGDIHVATTKAFEVDPDGGFLDGEMVVTNGNNADRVHVAVTDDQQLLIEVDSDTDKAYEGSVNIDYEKAVADLVEQGDQG